MRFASKRSRPQGEIPSSSMADIAFLLLIFFLVTTVFPRDRGLALVLPEMDNTQPVAPENLLQFLVLESGAVEIRRGDDTRGETIEARHVEQIWRSAAQNNDGLVAAVRTQPGAAYQRMIDVLDALSRAGADRVSLQLLTER